MIDENRGHGLIVRLTKFTGGFFPGGYVSGRHHITHGLRTSLRSAYSGVDVHSFKLSGPDSRAWPLKQFTALLHFHAPAPTCPDLRPSIGRSRWLWAISGDLPIKLVVKNQDLTYIEPLNTANQSHVGKLEDLKFLLVSGSIHFIIITTKVKRGSLFITDARSPERPPRLTVEKAQASSALGTLCKAVDVEGPSALGIRERCFVGMNVRPSRRRHPHCQPLVRGSQMVPSETPLTSGTM
ncbi:hypothetical protein OF83DRAFT_590027 [Amylostereum chailletii]|nr:hypothetical protein OF83DRAFT_590027 [Amylostereum chailletii]